MQVVEEAAHVLGLAELNIVEMTTLPKVMYRFKAFSVKIPMTLFTEQ